MQAPSSEIRCVFVPCAPRVKRGLMSMPTWYGRDAMRAWLNALGTPSFAHLPLYAFEGADALPELVHADPSDEARTTAEIRAFFLRSLTETETGRYLLTTYLHSPEMEITYLPSLFMAHVVLTDGVSNQELDARARRLASVVQLEGRVPRELAAAIAQLLCDAGSAVP